MTDFLKVRQILRNAAPVKLRIAIHRPASFFRSWLTSMIIVSGGAMLFAQIAPNGTEQTVPLILQLNDSKSTAAHEIDDIEIQKELNPIFLRITAAVVREDVTILRECADELEKKAAASPRLKVPASLARLVVLESIPDPEGYALQFGMIASWERRDLKEVTTISKRLPLYLLDLAIGGKADWREAVVQKAGSQLWPGADPLTVEIARSYVPTLKSYPAQAEYLAHLQREAHKLWTDETQSMELRAIWNDGRQELARQSIELHAAHFNFEWLWPEVQAYLDEFGTDGKHSRKLFALGIDRLNRARIQKISFDPRMVPKREWFDHWQKQLKEGGREATPRMMTESWEIYANWTDEPLTLGLIPGTDLVRDPRLLNSFSAHFSKPPLRLVLEKMSANSGVSIQVGPTTEPGLILAGTAEFSGDLYQVMRILAELESVQGQWERTKEGYVLHSTQKNPPSGQIEIKTNLSPMRLAFIGANFVIVGFVLRWILSRRRTTAALAGSTKELQPNSSSEPGVK